MFASHADFGARREFLDRVAEGTFLGMMPYRRRCAAALAALAAAGLTLGLPGVAQAQRACRVTEVVVTPPEAQTRVGGTYPFLAVAYDASGNPCENVTFAWTSATPAVATIAASGIATGVAVGQTVITARTGRAAASRSGTATLGVVSAEGVQTQADAPGNIRPVLGRPTGPGYAAFDRQPDGTGPAEGLYVDPLQMTLVRGESRFLDFRAVRGDGQNASRLPIIFSVDAGGERVAAVDSLGLITAHGEPGTATVRLVVPGAGRIQPKLVRVEVRADTLRFNRTVISVQPGTVETLSVFIPAQQRALDPSGLFQFSSSDPTKVRVNPVQPIIEALAAGTARIVAQSAIYPELLLTVNVHRRVQSLGLTPTDSVRTIAIGGVDTVRARALAADGMPVPEAPLTWRLSDSTAIAFDPQTGVVRGRRAGITDISVSAPTGRDSATQRSIRIRVVAGGLAASRTRLGIPHGGREPIDVVLLDDQRRPVGSAMPMLTWTSTADTVARVEGNHIVAFRPGRARLTARAMWDSTVAVDVFVVGDVIVAGQNEGRRDLIVKWNAGQNWAPLTADSLVELQAAWSPDLTRVLFTAQPAVPHRTPTSALYLMNLDRSERVRLTDDSAMVRFPSFVRGSARIVFEWSRGGRQQVWALDSAGATPRQVTQWAAAANTAPSVSPDGTRLVYVSARESSPGRSAYGVYTCAMDGSDERMLFSVPQGQRVDNPVFTPDGRAVLYVRSESGRPPVQRVWRRAIEPQAGDTAVAITPPTLYVRSFSVSGDGTLLALNILEPGQRNQQLSRVMLFTVATGATAALDASPEEQLASPAMRPAAPPAPAAAAPPGR